MTLIVDIHPHIVSRDTARYPISPLAGQRSDWSKDHSVDLDEMLRQMQQAGVDRMAIVHSSTTYGFNNDYVADSVSAYPGKLTGVFAVDILAEDGPAKMRHWVSRGCSGMRIYSRGKTITTALMALDDPRAFPCYETAGELGISVAVNPRIEQFGQLVNILTRFPSVTFILENLGKADFTGGAPFNEAKPLFELSRFANLYLKIKTENNLQAGKGKATPETMFGALIAAFGADRLAWGSNYPASEGSLKELADLARGTYAVLSAEDRAWLLGKTALKLYPALAE